MKVNFRCLLKMGCIAALLTAAGCIDTPNAPSDELNLLSSHEAPTPTEEGPISAPEFKSGQLDPRLEGLAAGICDEDSNKSSQANIIQVYNGTRQPTHVPLAETQINAVVAIGFGTPRGSQCSGTLISDNVVMTAVHCTENNNGDYFYAIFGQDDNNPTLSVRAVRKHEHPTLDLALLELEYAPSQRIDVTPIPIPYEGLEASQAGMTLEQAGYGQTEQGGGRGRFFVAERFDGFSSNNDNLVVNGEGRHGVCFGDSGGPALRLMPNGEVRVLGALSHGDSSCVGRDNYARAFVAKGWIEDRVGLTPGPNGNNNPNDPIGDPGNGDQIGGCNGLDLAGSCNDDNRTAVWCENNRIRVESCQGGDMCGWDGATNGWRCIEQQADSCGGLTHRGRCNAGVLEFCNEGSMNTRTCGACNEHCVLVNETLGFACVEAGIMLDSDEDSIPDEVDLCSATPPGTGVWSFGEWIGCGGGQFRDPPRVENDADSDGIANNIDLCNNTAPGRNVWKYGEWIGCAGGEQRDTNP